MASVSDPPSVEGPSVALVPEAMSEEQVLQTAYELLERSSDWVTFFREILGINGIVRRAFRTPDALCEFERTEEYAEIQLMLAQLRNQKVPDGEGEPIRMITVRLPKSMHEALRVEADEHHTSMNKLCISKLAQFIDHGLVPSDIQDDRRTESKRHAA